MQIISFKNTRLFKQGIYLTGAALIACSASPLVLNGSLWHDPLPQLVPLGMLCAFFLYFLWKNPLYRLADEVVDCGHYLQVSRGGNAEHILFANISEAAVTNGSGIHRITLRLLTPAKLGPRIEFLPQASLWSNIPAIRHVALSLGDRASQAKSRRVIV